MGAGEDALANVSAEKWSGECPPPSEGDGREARRRGKPRQKDKQDERCRHSTIRSIFLTSRSVEVASVTRLYTSHKAPVTCDYHHQWSRSRCHGSFIKGRAADQSIKAESESV